MIYDTIGEGTNGYAAVDIRLFQKTGRILFFDPGRRATASCESEITYIDGEKGILLYRGYPIQQVAMHGDFLETAYLLLRGELPTRDELDEFAKEVSRDNLPCGNRYLIHEQMVRILESHKRDTHPMLLIQSLVSALGAFDNIENFDSPEARNEVALNLIAKMPTIVAFAYRYSNGMPLIYPLRELNYVNNFLHMCFSNPGDSYYKGPKIFARALDKIFILHADHEQNASTSIVRDAGSTGVAPYAAISAGIVSLWGPAHGGANEKVLQMLRSIKSRKDIPEMIKRVEAGTGYRIPGFGHPVYITSDPRAGIIRDICHDALTELNAKDPLFAYARELEQRALESKYFQERNLYPNVDFYSGIIMKLIGFPESMFTTLFALARTVGWIAQWKEMVEGKIALSRPRQVYKGHKHRDWVPIDERVPICPRNRILPSFGGTKKQTCDKK